MLSQAMGVEGAEEEGDENAVGSAEDERSVGGEDAGGEGHPWKEGGEGVEGEGEEDVSGEEIERVEEKRVHVCGSFGRRLWRERF